MARPLRYLEQADWYHVYNRGADRQDIFSLPGDHELFESLTGETSEATAVEVHSYALMSNHFHFLIHDPMGTLPMFMQNLCGRYALAYNSRTGRTGPLFTGRYSTVPITDDRHLLIEARYVERNPLAFVPPSSLAAYRHSSLGVVLGQRSGPAWLRTDVLLPMIAESDYLDFVLREHDSDRHAPEWLPVADPPGIADLFRAAFDVCAVDVVASSGPARNVTLAVAFEFRLAASTEIADVLGISSAGVRMAARRGRVLVDTDDRMAGLKQRITQLLCA